MNPPPLGTAVNALQPGEPLPERLANPLLRYFLATRPAFLAVTLAGCLVGIASAHRTGVPLQWIEALLTVLFALVAHAGGNVLNDYYDALNGSDAANTARLFPFTGGSRFIQNGVLTPRETRAFGWRLMAAVVPAGLWLAWRSGPGLLGIGFAGMVLGWAYSAPPLKLASRGLGELAVAAGWLAVVVGADFVQRGAFAFAPVAAGLGFALLVANLLYINQFPDAAADALAGKRTLVVRLGPEEARWGYLALALLAYAWPIMMVERNALPQAAAAAALPIVLSFRAAQELLHHAAEPAELGRAVKLTIAAALAHGLLMAGALFLAGPA